MKKLLALAASSLLAATLLPTAVLADERPTIAVIEFKNDSGAGWWRGGVGRELAGMLGNELSATRNFRVLERSKLEAVLEEQNLGASGRVAEQAAQIGKLVGAQYLVAGTVTAYEEDVSRSGGGISFGGVSVGGKSESAYLAVDLRVIDSSTGEVAYARTIEGRSKGGGMSLGVYRGGFGGTLASEEKTPAGKAIRAALVEASGYLECVMVVRSSKCMREYDAKEDKRRESSRDSLKLD